MRRGNPVPSLPRDAAAGANARKETIELDPNSHQPSGEPALEPRPEEAVARPADRSRSLAASLVLACALGMTLIAGLLNPAVNGHFMDQMCYLNQALSFAHDFDFEYDIEDRRRFQKLGWGAEPTGLYLRETGGRYFVAKPAAYAVFAAPLTALLGARGPVVTNALLWSGLLFLSWFWLMRWFPPVWAALLSIGTWTLSSAVFYVFLVHPEVFCMFTVAAFLHLTLTRFTAEPGAIRRPLARAAWAGLWIGLAIYSKPPIALLGASILALYATRRLWREAALLAVTAGAVAAAFTLVHYFEDGQFSPYSGNRIYVGAADPLSGSTVPDAWFPAQTLESSWIRPHVTGSSDFRDYTVPADTATTASAAGDSGAPAVLRQSRPRHLLNNVLPYLPTLVSHFFVGRKAGLFPYLTPFLLLMIVGLFEKRRDRRFAVWWVAAPVALYALTLLVMLPLHYHGAGIGNRYLSVLVPAFLYCIGAPHGRRTALGLALGILAAGLYFPGPELLRPDTAVHRNFAIMQQNRMKFLPVEPELLQRSIDTVDGISRPDPDTIVFRLSPAAPLYSPRFDKPRSFDMRYGVLRTEQSSNEIRIAMESVCEATGEIRSGDAPPVAFHLKPSVPVMLRVRLSGATAFSLGGGPQRYWPLEFTVNPGSCADRGRVFDIAFLPLPPPAGLPKP